MKEERLYLMKEFREEIKGAESHCRPKCPAGMVEKPQEGEVC